MSINETLSPAAQELRSRRNAFAEQVATAAGWKLDGDAFKADDGLYVVPVAEVKDWIGLCGTTDIDLVANEIASRGTWLPMSDEAKGDAWVVIKINGRPYQASWHEDLSIFVLEYCNRGHWGPIAEWMPIPEEEFPMVPRCPVCGAKADISTINLAITCECAHSSTCCRPEIVNYDVDPWFDNEFIRSARYEVAA